MRQLIRLYGDSMQALVPQYLDFSLGSLISNQQKLREQFVEAFGQTPFALLEEQTRKNMAAFTNALRMLTPFGLAGSGLAPQAEAGGSGRSEEIDEMKREMERMRERLERLAQTPKPKGEPKG
jgi:polyhydroxyalkanoate synthesis regulator protein